MTHPGSPRERTRSRLERSLIIPERPGSAPRACSSAPRSYRSAPGAPPEPPRALPGHPGAPREPPRALPVHPGARWSGFVQCDGLTRRECMSRVDSSESTVFEAGHPRPDQAPPRTGLCPRPGSAPDRTPPRTGLCPGPGSAPDRAPPRTGLCPGSGSAPDRAPPRTAGGHLLDQPPRGAFT